MSALEANETVDPSWTIYDRIVEVLLVALLAFLPFAFGGVTPLSHFVVVAVAAAMAICLALRCLLATDRGFVWSWSYVPVAGFLGLVTLQLIALPRDLVQSVSPRTASLWSELLGDPDVAANPPTQMSLSLYPDATWTDLRLLLAGATIFVVVVNVFRRSSEIKRLLSAVAIIGSAVAVLAFAQILTGTSQIFWYWETPGPETVTGGPFVHQGHFSQFLNLAMGCTFGLLLLRLSERLPRRLGSIEDLFVDLRDPGRRVDLWLLVFVVAAIVAIALSRSRNGVISMLVAGAVSAAVLQRTRYLVGIGWPLIGLLFLAFLVLLFLGFDPIYDRMATLEDPGSEYASRLALLTDTMRAIGEFPWLGMGQGTYEFTFPMFDTDTRPRTAAHAENLYAEILAETGFLGFAILAAFGVIVLVLWVRRLRRQGRAVHGVVFGLGFGLIAVAVHAVTDFGLRIPAVAVLAIVSTGVVVSMATRSATASDSGTRVWGSAVSSAMAGLLLASAPAAYRAWQADANWSYVAVREERLGAPDFTGTPAQYDNILTHARRAVELAPGNIEYRYWTPIYEWYRTLAAAKATAAPDERRATIEHTPELIAAARRTQAALLEAREVCPTYGPLWSIAGQLGVLWLDEPAAGRWIARGRELAPHHDMTCLAAARQLTQSGDDAAAIATFRRAIQLGTGWQVVLRALTLEFARPDLAIAVAAGDAQQLHWLSLQLARDPEHAELASEVTDEAHRLMTELCAAGTALPWMHLSIARYHETRDDDEIAERFYLSFLRLAPGSRSGGARIRFAKLLARMGKTERARAEARRVLGLDPTNAAATRLLEELR